MQIVEDEHLDVPVLNGVGRLQLDAVVLERRGDGWTAYLVDERAQPFETTVKTFVDESDALDYVLLKLRQVARARRSQAALHAKRAAAADSDDF
ncbi:hypothetical protein [Microbacterium sp.]|uniref:hypothetical protein n=1 Tax=Microbacterium sp. TaxID=51671 RepID=UPI0039E38D6A